MGNQKIWFASINRNILGTAMVSLLLLVLFHIVSAYVPVYAATTRVNPVGVYDCVYQGGKYSEVGGVVVYDYDSATPATLKNALPICQSVDVGALGFKIPTLGDILTFAIRAFFAIAGISALFYMILGAFGWITSGGDKDAITAAREKIQAAVVGMILVVGVLAVIWTLEQVIFKRRICLGLSCPVTLPGLVRSEFGQNCCACVNQATGAMTSYVNTYYNKCNNDGTSTPL